MSEINIDKKIKYIEYLLRLSNSVATSEIEINCSLSSDNYFDLIPLSPKLKTKVCKVIYEHYEEVLLNLKKEQLG